MSGLIYRYKKSFLKRDINTEDEFQFSHDKVQEVASLLRTNDEESAAFHQWVGEVLLAFNASAEGDATSELLSRQLEGMTRVSRPARGLPVGADLDLADRVTLAFALEGRQSV